MHPGWESELSVRRAPKRERALLMLASLGEAHPAALAQAVGVPITRLRWLMHGHPPEYRRELSPIALGWAELIHSANGRYYRITPKGLRKARNLAARKVRAAQRARATRRWERLAGGPGQVDLHVTSRDRSDGDAPDPSPTRHP